MAARQNHAAETCPPDRFLSRLRLPTNTIPKRKPPAGGGFLFGAGDGSLLPLVPTPCALCCVLWLRGKTMPRKPVRRTGFYRGSDSLPTQFQKENHPQGVVFFLELVMGVGPMNLVITNDALYQLSYTSAAKRIIAKTHQECKPFFSKTLFFLKKGRAWLDRLSRRLNTP